MGGVSGRVPVRLDEAADGGAGGATPGPGELGSAGGMGKALKCEIFYSLLGCVFFLKRHKC